MINQEKTGSFIVKMRKAKGLTQKQLADLIGVSDKAVSRWETGRGLPETSIMPELCNALDININELLSGERLSQEDYNGKAEMIMVDLMKDSEENAKLKKSNIIGTVMGLILLILFLYAITIMTGGVRFIVWFIDTPSVIAVIGIQLITLSASGLFGDFFGGLRLVFRPGKFSQEERPDIASKAVSAISLAIKAACLGGGVTSLIGIVMIMGVLKNPELIGPNLAVAILSMFYGLVLALILLIFQGRLQKIK